MSNFINVQDRPYLLAVAQGQITGASIQNIWGYNPDIDATATKEDVWGYAATLFELPTSQVLQIYSSSPNDASAGTGMRTVRITGLDANGAEQSETLTMNGATQVDTAGTYSFVNKFRALTVGSNNSNFGEIYIRGKVDTTYIVGVMNGGAPGDSVSNGAFYEIPANKTGYILSASVGYGYSNAPSNLGMNFFLRTKVPTAQGGSGIWEVSDMITVPTGATQQKRYDVPYALPARTRVKMSVNGGTANFTSFASMQILVIDS